MKIFKLYNEVNGYASVDFTNVNMSDIAKGIVNVSAISDINLNWKIDEDDNVKGYCPFYLGAFPVFDATKVKGCSFERAEIAQFRVEDRGFVAVAAPILLGQIIDKEKSDLRLFKSGKIMSVKRFALKKNISYPPIFRLEEYPLFTFVSEGMMNSLKKTGLTQLGFEECVLTD